jgi:hypothetical protein
VSASLLLVLLLFAPFILLSLWSIGHAFVHAFPTTEEQMLWIFLATLVPVIGGVVYFRFGSRRAMGRRKWPSLK